MLSKKIQDNHLISLKITKEDNKEKIYLENVELRGVESYTIESVQMPGAAKLIIEMVVKFP